MEEITSKPGRILGWIQWGGITIAIVITLLIIAIRQRHHKMEMEQVRKNTQLEMIVVKDRVQKYLQNVYTILRFISLNDEVGTMSRDSYDYIEAIYEDTYERSFLSEIYVIKRDFDGTHPPFMSFEHGDEEKRVEKMHNLESEEWEYKTQIEHIRRFVKNPALEALSSSPGELCTNKTGIVYSLPIRYQDKLVGIVVGMIPEENISEILKTIGPDKMAILVNEQGDTFVPEDVESIPGTGFRSQLTMQKIKELAKKNKEFRSGKYQIVTAAIKTHDGQEWYLAFMHDNEAYLANNFSGILSRYGISAMVFLLGVTITFLCKNLYKRLVIEGDLRRSKEDVEKVNKQLQIKISEVEWGRQAAMNMMADSERTKAKAVKAEKELQKTVEELEQFNKLAVGRELQMIELKKEVDTILCEFGRKEKYKSDYEEILSKPLI